MKTLKQFWQWFDGEQPPAKDARLKGKDNLSGVAKDAIDYAHHAIAARAGWDFDREDEAQEQFEHCLDTHPEALRDLSLALCEALERMREVVPKAKREEACLHRDLVYSDGLGTCQDCGREEPWPVALSRTDTFRDVDSGKYTSTLAEAKPVCPTCRTSPCHPLCASQLNETGTFSNLQETDPAKLREQMIANIEACTRRVVGMSTPRTSPIDWLRPSGTWQRCPNSGVVTESPFGKDGEVRASAPLPEPRSLGRYPMVYAGSWVDQQQAREQACQHEWYLSAGGAHCLKCAGWRCC